MRGVLLAIVAGCAYRAGSFSSWGHDFAGHRTTVGCLDLAIDRRDGSVLAYDFANRCERPITVDLRGTSVIARTPQGDVAMVPFDPERELRALPLDASSVGAEAIAYRTETPVTAVAQICVDAASIVGAARSDWQCM